jgi:hypothetical protein
MKNKKEYANTTRSNAKYIRLTELVDIVNKDAIESKKVSRETLLARIKSYIAINLDQLKKEGVDLIKQDPSNSPEKSPILVDYDYIQKNIPSLVESEIIKNLIEKVTAQEERLKVIYEICYLKGFLRRIE